MGFRASLENGPRDTYEMLRDSRGSLLKIVASIFEELPNHGSF